MTATSDTTATDPTTGAGPAAADTGARRRSISLGEAARTFLGFPSPWLIAAVLAVAATARVLVGGWGAADTALLVLLVATFPFVEWVAHVFVLHFRPREVGRRTIDLYVAQKHRAHHAAPRDLPLIFIPMRVLVLLLVAYTVAVFTVFPRVSLGLTFLAGQAAIGLVYEWTHYLVHTDYRPRSRVYRSIWRNHRLHHYKNEGYWFTVTTAGTADRLLGTYPDPAAVPTSPTATTLRAGLG